MSREPHEFTHPVPTYQVFASQSNQEAEQTLGLVHTEQSFRNAKANMGSALTSTVVDSDFEDHDFTDADREEEEGEAEWVNTSYFPVEHVLEEYKAQAKRAMKEAVVQDPIHKKLSYLVIDSINLNKMQFISLHTKLIFVQ